MTPYSLAEELFAVFSVYCIQSSSDYLLIATFLMLGINQLREKNFHMEITLWYQKTDNKQ